MFVIVAVSLLLFSEETISEEEMITSRECKAEMKREISGILRKGSKDYINSHEQLLLQYHKYSKYSSILKERDVLLSLLIYLFISFVQITVDSLFSPVLANKKIYGGFEMSSVQISLILMVASPIALVTSEQSRHEVTLSFILSFSPKAFHLSQKLEDQFAVSGCLHVHLPS